MIEIREAKNQRRFENRINLWEEEGGRIENDAAGGNTVLAYFYWLILLYFCRK